MSSARFTDKQEQVRANTATVHNFSWRTIRPFYWHSVSYRGESGLSVWNDKRNPTGGEVSFARAKSLLGSLVSMAPTVPLLHTFTSALATDNPLHIERSSFCGSDQGITQFTNNKI